MVVKVRVPASTANLGPGFDTIGMALNIYNYIELDLGKSGLNIESTGIDAELIPKDANNITYQIINTIFEKAGFIPHGISIKLESNIPVARGLGSSSAALVGGALAANAMLNTPLSEDELLEILTNFEGHPDNVAPALLGGIITSIYNSEHVIYKKINPPKDLHLVVAIPDYTLPTIIARNALPQNIPMRDAVFNISHAALLIAALLEGDYQMIGHAMKDKIHQPYRLPLVPGMDKVFQAALDAGAVSVALSGAGPTLIAFCDRYNERIGIDMQNAFARCNIPSMINMLLPDLAGAKIISY